MRQGGDPRRRHRCWRRAVGDFPVGTHVQDGRVTSAGKPHVISQQLQFAAIDKAGNTVNAGIAPHLNLRPAKPEEVASVRDLLDESWLTTDLEKAAIRFATVELAQGHIAEVKARRLPRSKKGRAGSSRPAQERDQLLGLARLRG